ncbi:fimbrial protein [Parabacteroides sp. PF5-6]|uniref:fimbrial protein n=1 Tax=Parabacteroides sp. PF5-6 TaxID=1742403 RepID=UPI002405C241|nr:fimbrial protein [Parabacteroides sp. PF5-6]MDF9829890.1 hypothetical protein [Parabacteroides sp. PF5-6]
MKLKNLLFGTMVALAFTACSSDNDPVIEPTPTPGADAAFLNVKTMSIQTKAETGDATITNMHVFVYSGGNLEIKSSNHGLGVYTDANDEVTEIAVSPGNKEIIVVANAPAGAFDDVVKGTAKSVLLGKTVDLATEVLGEDAKGFSMNSGLFAVSLQANVNNFLGYTDNEITAAGGGYKVVPAAGNLTVAGRVPLYRNVAKINLKGVNISKNLNATQYPNAAFTVKAVYLLHTPKLSSLIANDYKAWGPTYNVSGGYYNSATNTVYANSWVKYMTTPYNPEEIDETKLEYPVIKKAFINAALDGAPVYANLSNLVYEMPSGTITAPWAPGANENENADECYFYAYENAAKGNNQLETLLVVMGDFSWDSANKDEGRITASERYYPVAVGVDGVAADGFTINSGFFGAVEERYTTANGKFFGVLRNLEYNVTVGIAGVGYKTPFGPPTGPGEGPGPDETVLHVATEVVDFGQVTQGHVVTE